MHVHSPTTVENERSMDNDLPMIVVKLHFGLTQLDFEMDGSTLRDLLHELSTNIKTTKYPRVDIFDSETGEVYPDCLILVNGQPYDLLNNGLDTKLSNGDKVEVYPIMLAGG